VGKSELVTPISSSYWNDSELGKNDGSSDSSGDFLGALDSESNVSISVSNYNESLESGSLSGSGLLLDGHDLENFILEFSSQKVINNLVLFDGESKEVDFFNLSDVLLSN